MQDTIRHRFLAALREQIHSHGLFSAADRWLLAVSGGADSMAMLHGLILLQRETDWAGPEYYHIAHLNHQLRGADSDADAEFVRAEAEKLGLDYTIGSVKVAEAAKETGESLESAARTERYQFLAQTAIQNHCTKIVLAHNADDQAETILHRILRGTGIRGLAGIPVKRKLEAYGPADQPLILIRPLLAIPRKEIEEFVQSENITCRIDISNYSLDHTRNRLRHALLPQLADQYNPQVIQALNRLGQTAGWMSELLHADVQAVLAKLTTSRTENSIRLDLAGLQTKTVMQQTELIHQAMGELCVGLRPIGFTHIQAILELIAAADLSRRTLDLPNRLQITRSGDQLIFQIHSPPALGRATRPPTEISLPIHQEVEVEQPIVGYFGDRAEEIQRIRTESLSGGPEIFSEFRRQKTGADYAFVVVW